MILASEEKIREYFEKGWWGNKTLLDYFKEHVEANPERIALVDPLNREELVGTAQEKISYRQLDQAAYAVATYLAKLGVGKDDIVMVQLPNTWELAMLYLAVSRTGAIISPAPMQWRLKELEYVARHTAAKCIITISDFKGYKHLEMALELRDRVSSLQHLLTLEDVGRLAKSSVDKSILENVSINANDIFTVCWTSGTEAEPKGCPLSHNNWLFENKTRFTSVDIRPGDVQLTAGPLVNIASVGSTLVPWLEIGGTLVLHHPFDPLLFVRQIIEEKVNYTLLVPAVTNMIVKNPLANEWDLSSVRTIVSGGAPLSLYTLQEFKRRWNIEIVNNWGQNEGTQIISGIDDVPEMGIRVNQLPHFGTPGVKWKAFTEGVQTKMVDPNTGEVLTEVGSIGELAYKGPNVISEYFKNHDLTKKCFDNDGYFYTGDLFQIKENNLLMFYDRKKDIIIRGGYNISAQELENILMAHPKVQDVAAVGIPDEVMGEKTCVFVVPKPGVEVELKDITDFMKEQGVAVYKLPEKLQLINEIPRNAVGKILKVALRQRIKESLAPTS